MQIDELKEALTAEGFAYHEQVEPVRTTEGQKIGDYVIVYALRNRDGEAKRLGVKNLILSTALYLLKQNEVWQQLNS